MFTYLVTEISMKIHMKQKLIKLQGEMEKSTMSLFQ